MTSKVRAIGHFDVSKHLRFMRLHPVQGEMGQICVKWLLFETTHPYYTLGCIIKPDGGEIE
jgi:hypothetical protein